MSIDREVIPECMNPLTFVVQKVQSACDVLHHNACFLFAEVSPSVNVVQDGAWRGKTRTHTKPSTPQIRGHPIAHKIHLFL